MRIKRFNQEDNYDIKSKYLKKESELSNKEGDNDGNNKEDLVIYSKFAQEVIDEINFARTKPSEYAAKLERISSTLKGRKVKVGKSTMKLKEGSAIFEEAIQYLLNIYSE